MKTVYTLLLAALFFFLPALSFADGIDAGGSYQVTGTVTMTAGAPGACGNTPCVETLAFAFSLSTTPFDFFGTPSAFDTLSNGTVTANGPIGGQWTVGLWQGYAGGFVGLYFQSDLALPPGQYLPPEIDAPGFNSPDGFPHSFTGPAWFYACAGVVCDDFGFQYSGTQSITVTQTPEPNPFILLAAAALCFLAFSLARRTFAPANSR